MKTPVTIDSLLTRIKKEVAEKDKKSEIKKGEARIERLRRQAPPSMYAKEELWTPVALHREYEVQHCDCCKDERTVFNQEKVELHHKVDRSARRWLRERGEGMDNLPLHIIISERSIPECFACITTGKILHHLFRNAA